VKEFPSLGCAVFALGLVASGVAVQSQSHYGSLSCQELWRSRNAIYASKGYCFSSPEAQAAFGKGCFPPYGQLSPAERQEASAILQHEKQRGCPPSPAALSSGPLTRQSIDALPVQIPAYRGHPFRRIADSVPVIADSF
jgi:hypothetical protein